MNVTERERLLDCLNSMEVLAESSGEEAYVLVENNEKNRKLLDKAGIPLEKALSYGDNETFCILALALSEGYANGYDDKLTYKDDCRSGDRRITTEQLKTALEEKIEHIDERIERISTLSFYDQSKRIKNLQSEALAYKNVLKMIEGDSCEECLFG